MSSNARRRLSLGSNVYQTQKQERQSTPKPVQNGYNIQSMMHNIATTLQLNEEQRRNAEAFAMRLLS